MIVRVFKYVGEPGEEYLGSDFEFEVMPSVGQLLRLSDEVKDFEIEKVGYIQDEGKFVAAVWLKKPRVSIADMI